MLPRPEPPLGTLLRGGFLVALLTVGSACSAEPPVFRPGVSPVMSEIERLPKTTLDVPTGKAVATFATGCFWCTEAQFQSVKGVEKVSSGYSGGHVANPTYEQVSTKHSGHAEAVQIVYDPEVIDYKTLLEMFWKAHDPTTLNRQGADVGPQYRSAIFYHTDEQRQLAEAYKKKLDESGAFNSPIVTEITPFANFYTAEGYHQDYFFRNPGQGYCQVVIVPKLQKFREVFAGKLKETADYRDAE